MDHALQGTDRGRPTSALLIALLALLAWVAPHPLLAQGVESRSGHRAETSADKPDEPAWLGVQIAQEADRRDGAAVARILEGSPAERSTLEEGDRLLAASGEKVDDLASLRRALAPHRPGEEVTLEIHRDGNKQSVTVVLSMRPTPRQVLRAQFVGSQLPTLDLENLKGGKIRLDDPRETPLVIEFWATWCPPCRHTQETLARLDEKFDDKVDIVGISPEDPARLKAYRKQVDLPYRLLHDPGRMANQQLMVASYPTMFVVDADGTIREVFTGTGHKEALELLLKRLLD